MAARLPETGVVVYGGGGHGRTLIDLLAASRDLWPAAVVDDGDVGATVLGVPFAGGRDALAELLERGYRLAANAIGPIGSTDTREQVFDVLAAAGFTFPSLVHERATVERSASVGAGVQVLAGAYVGSAATIAFGTIVNTLAVVSHDCALGAHVHIAPGALLAGEVRVGDRALIGLGVTVHIGVEIGPDARIGNSAVVKASVPAGTRIRAGAIWPGGGTA